MNIFVSSQLFWYSCLFLLKIYEHREFFKISQTLDLNSSCLVLTLRKFFNERIWVLANLNEYFLVAVSEIWYSMWTIWVFDSCNSLMTFDVFYDGNNIFFGFTIGEKKSINSELWHACAGPLVSLPPVGSLVVYFPQGHSEQVCHLFFFSTPFILFNIQQFLDSDSNGTFQQLKFQVAASMQKETDFIPNYPNLPSKLICMLHNVTLHVWESQQSRYCFKLIKFYGLLMHMFIFFKQADPETDEVYAQMTLQPVNKVGQWFNLRINMYTIKLCLFSHVIMSTYRACFWSICSTVWQGSSTGIWHGPQAK